MIVKSVRVRNYKSITDSGAVKPDEDVTCLVGKNESGKTAFLEALYRINPITTGHPETFDGLRDFPRVRWAAERASVPAKTPIEVEFELADNDIKAIEEEFGKGVLRPTAVTRSRAYDNTFTTAIPSANLDEKTAMKHVLGRAGLPKRLADGCSSFEDLAEKLRGKEVLSGEETQLLEEIDELDLAKGVRGLLKARYPRFLYFDEYSVMPGRVSIPRLQQHQGDLDSGERTALALLRLAGVETADFAEEDYEPRRAALEAASNQITKEVFDYWSQNKDLLVELDLDFNSPSGQRVGEMPPFLEIRIRNLRHGVSLNFGERSAGFVWFFSFLVAFSEYRDSEMLVLLLDEPGLGLHASAQADLLRYIEERLAPDHQVIYTTHSPFMVDPTRLERVRLVEDVEDDGTRVSEDVLGTSRETLFPLQAALGYELAQTLFVGPDNLVVEGPADYVFLTVMGGQLKSLGRTGLDERWTIVPVGGLDKIPTFIALLGAHLNVAVVLDAQAGGSQKINSLVDRGVIDAKNVLPLNKITGGSEADIEDLFDEDFYLDLLRTSKTANVSKTKLGPGSRIVKRIEAVAGSYDHYQPARHFLEHQVELLAQVDEATLDRFENLFAEVNKLCL